ncbi:unnamed protein product [Sympodiomycopsis kandeliae]
MPLNIAQHKSYHPYNRANRERVQRDEEEAHAQREEQRRRDQVNQSHDRLAALRQQRDGADATSLTEFKADESRQDGGNRDSARRSDKRRAEDRHEQHDGLSLTALVSNKAWYDDPDLRSHKERKRTQEQTLEAAYKDSATKSVNDPLKAIAGFLAQREQAKSESRREASAQQQVPPHPEASSNSYRHYVDDHTMSSNTDETNKVTGSSRVDGVTGQTMTSIAEPIDAKVDMTVVSTTSANEDVIATTDARLHGQESDKVIVKTEEETVHTIDHAPEDHSIRVKSEPEDASVITAECAVDRPVKSEQEDASVLGPSLEHGPYDLSTSSTSIADLSKDSLDDSFASGDQSFGQDSEGQGGHRRESMYPVLLGEMVATVLADESYLFNEVELATLRAYSLLPYDGRYLLSRLIQRRDSWLRVEALRSSYASESKEGIDVDAAVQALAQPVSDQAPQQYLITHADAGSSDQEALLELLTLDELKTLAKRMHVTKPGTTKASIIKALASTRSQGTLMSAFAGKGAKPGVLTSRSQTTLTGNRPSNQASIMSSLTLQVDGAGKKASQATRLANEVTDLLGLLVRIHPDTRSLIDRVALVFYRGSMLGGTALTTAVLARSRRRNYPRYQVQRSSNVFPSRENLLAFEEALTVEAQMEEVLQWGDNSEATWNKALAMFESVWPVWKATVEKFDADQRNRQRIPADEDAKLWSVDASDRMTYHRMRFHAGWPQTRIVYKGTNVLARFKMHDREEEVLKALLGQKYFRRGKRGEWYDRLALITALYSQGQGQQSGGGKAASTPAAAKLQGKTAALAIAVAGIEDPDTHLIYHDTLQRRITRLENQLPIPKSQKHDFSYAKLKQCAERTYYGTRLDYMDYGQDEKQQQLFPELMRRSSSPSKAGAVSSGGSGFQARAPMRKIVKVEQKQQQEQNNGAGRSRSPLKNSSTSASPSPAAASRPKSSFFMKRDSSSSSDLLLQDPRAGAESASGSTSTSVDSRPSGGNLAPVSPSPTPEVEVGKNALPDSIMSDYDVVRKEKRTSMASVWRGPLDGQPCRVEDVVLQEYQMQGYQGNHDEGGLLKMLFTMCLWDVIFSPQDISDVFETPYQRAPLDLGQDSFSITRGPQLRQRLQEISAGSAPTLVSSVDERERPLGTWAIGCRWDTFPLDSLLQVATLIPGSTLSTIFTMMAEEWEHCSSGMPDLIVWNSETKVVRLCEVKSINDRLSETQKVWIDVLLRAGMEVEVSLVREEVSSIATGQRPSLIRKRSSTESRDEERGKSGSPLKRRVS